MKDNDDGQAEHSRNDLEDAVVDPETKASLLKCLPYCSPFRLFIDGPNGKASCMYPAARPECGGLQSLKKLYRVGLGPSSSHTMGPFKSAERFRRKYPNADYFEVTLYGSLAATGVGHMTHLAIQRGLKVDSTQIQIIWKPNVVLPRHPNAMQFKAFSNSNSQHLDDRIDADQPEDVRSSPPSQSLMKSPKLGLQVHGHLLGTYICYSVGGGAVIDDASVGGPPGTKGGEIFNVYSIHTMNGILEWCHSNGKLISDYVYETEGRQEMTKFLTMIWETMQAAIERGLNTTGILPGGIGLRRKARTFYLRSLQCRRELARTPKLFAYALAVAEENASSNGDVVTSPTCGSCGILPSILRYLSESLPGVNHRDILDGLAIAGLFCNVAKSNASISGAEAGCAAEVGVACSGAAAAACHLMGGSSTQVEYAAQIALEHHLGLSCDPAGGLVQIPCVERNAMAATRAVDAAEYSIMSDGDHKVSYDEVILAMYQTGLDLNSAYRETAKGGLARTAFLDERLDNILKIKLNEVANLQSKDLEDLSPI